MDIGCQGLRKIGAGGLDVCSDGKRSKNQPQVHLACRAGRAGVWESGTRAGAAAASCLTACGCPAQINDRLISGCILGLRGKKER